MKAILLGSSGFWRELEVHDYPPTLKIPLWEPISLNVGADQWKGPDVAVFHRVAVSTELQGAPRLVVYAQEAKE